MNTIKINLEGIPAGFYMLSLVTSKDQLYSKKFTYIRE